MFTPISNADANNNPVPVYNQQMPKGNIIKSLPLVLNLGAGIPQVIDLTNQQTAGIIDQIQAAWIDNSANTGTVTINTGAAQQNVILKTGWQGFVPLMVSNPPILTVTSSATATVMINLMNVPMPCGVWPTT